MSVATLKVLLAFSGILAFLGGIRLGLEPLRWTGVGLVAAAFALRFLPRRPRRPTDPSSSASSSSATTSEEH